MRRILCTMTAAILLIVAALPARAAVNVVRESSENPMKEVGKSIAYGGLAGLTLRRALEGARAGGDEDAIRWGFAGGTFAGAGLGLYFVLSRPNASAMIQIENGRLRLALAQPVIEPGPGVRLSLVRAKF